MSSKDLASEVIPAGKSEAFSLWQMPSFDAEAENVIENEKLQEEQEEQVDSAAEQAEELLPEEPEELQESEAPAEVEVEEVELETVQPLTLEEVEAVRQDAYNEGFSEGEKDGFHAGQLRARQEAEAALQPRLQALDSLIQQLFDPINEQDQAIEHMLLQLVQVISEEVIQRELILDSSQIQKVLREAMKMLPMEDGQVRIHVNPQDFDAIRSLRERHEESWRILEDDNLLPGGCRIETLNSQIDASVETRLRTLTQQLLEQQRHLQAEPVAADIQQDIDLTPAEVQPLMPVEEAAVEVPEQEVAEEEQLAAQPDEPAEEQTAELDMSAVPEVAVPDGENGDEV